MAQYDAVACSSSCGSIQEKCDSTNAKVLFNNGSVAQPTDPSPASANYVCSNSALLYQSGSIPYTIIRLVIRSAGILTLGMRYQPVNLNKTWFNFPSQKYKKQELPLILGISLYDPYLNKYEFAFPVEGVAFEITGATYKPNSNEECFQGGLVGCYFALPMSLSFEQPYFSQWLTDATLPVKGKFICSTNGRPFYYLSMQVVNRIKSKTLTRDFSQKIYVNNSPTNDDLYNGIQGLAVTLNFVSADELDFEFQKLNFMGLVYYYGSFDCYGEVSMINSMLYGHFNKGHLEVLYTHDLNECLTYTECSDRGTCINLIGSFYCKCTSPYFGDGYNCYVKQDWFYAQRGVYSTSEFKEYTIPELYYRGLFYANRTKELYACGSYKKNSKYGCLSSRDLGLTWNFTQPRLDIIFGQSSDGNLYGYSTLDSSYLMFNSLLNTWYSIPPESYYRTRSTIDFNSDKVILPTSNITVDARRNEALVPLQHGLYRIDNYLLAVTLNGISKSLNETQETWVSYFYWENLPFIG